MSTHAKRLAAIAGGANGSAALVAPSAAAFPRGETRVICSRDFPFPLLQVDDLEQHRS